LKTATGYRLPGSDKGNGEPKPAAEFRLPEGRQTGRELAENDWQLVQRALAGDQQGFRELFDRYHRQVLAIAVGMTGNGDDAMDVVQETFVRAHKNLGSFLGESSFYTWLYRIAVNVAIDFRRRRSRRAEIVQVEPIDENVSDGDRAVDPRTEVERRELGARILKGIDELTPEHKAAIILREIEGLSYEEISKVMRCSKGTVMSRLHYARKKLQAKLRELL
jgi:RNA polymerase sigma-70 factor (ECF subfamily)